MVMILIMRKKEAVLESFTKNNNYFKIQNNNDCYYINCGNIDYEKEKGRHKYKV